MSKRRRTNPNNKFVMLERWFWRCPAWQALPHPARSLYIELELLFTGSNNGELGLGVRKAAELVGCSLNHACKLFAEIEAKGFIRPAQRGAFGWKKRHVTTWILTRYEYQGKPATSDFMRWQKQNTVAPRATISTTPCDYGGSEAPPIVAPGDTMGTDSGKAIVAPRDTLYSIPPIPCSEFQPKKGKEHMRSAPPSAGPHKQNRFAKLRGSRRAKAEWLRSHLEAGIVTPAAVADALNIRPDEVEPIASGKIGLANTSWQKLAGLVATKVN